MAEGSFHIHVHDLCLDVGTKLTANIHVSSVYSIDVQVADKVSGGKVVVVLRPIVFCSRCMIIVNYVHVLEGPLSSS